MFRIILALLFTFNTFGQVDYSVCDKLSEMYKDQVHKCLKNKEHSSAKSCLNKLGQSAHNKYPQCARIIINAYKKWVEKGELPPGM